MPKLGADVASQVDEAEVQDFSPLPVGIYPCVLREVEVKEGKKAPYWNWEYEVIPGHEYAGRRFWNVTSLSPKAAFKMKETFEAFGVPTTTDTDELVGSVVNLEVIMRTIQEGDRAGQQANQVAKVLPYDGEVADDDEEPF